MRLGSLILAVLASLVAFAPPARASCPTGQTTLSSLQGEILACISNQTAANSISPGTVGSVLTDILNFSAATVSGLSPLATTSPGSGVVGALGAAVNGSSGMALLNGAPAAGDCLKWSSSGIQDAGVACAGSSGGVSSGTAGQLA